MLEDLSEICFGGGFFVGDERGRNRAGWSRRLIHMMRLTEKRFSCTLYRLSHF